MARHPLHALPALVALAFASASAGCSKKAEGDPYAAELATMCDAGTRANAPATEPARSTAIAVWVPQQGLSDKARLFWTGILGFDPPVRAQKLRDEAKAHGIERCALAEEWAAPPKPLVPPMPMQQ
jgi:hypothetical protein